MPAAEPTGASGLVFWMLCSLGGEASAREVSEAMAREGDRADVSPLLQGLARRLPPLVEQAGISGRGRVALYRLTRAGRDLAFDREPCGTGWPG